MARITVEDCLRNVDNRFELIHLSAKRVRQLRKGSEPLVVCKNKDTVVSLREIAAGKVFRVNNREGDYLTQDTEGSDITKLPQYPDESSPGEEPEKQQSIIGEN